MTLTLDTYTSYGQTYTSYRYRPDASLDPAPVDAVTVDTLPVLDLTATARRLLAAIQASGLPWDVTLWETYSGGQTVDVRVHHLTGRWSLARWGWHQRRLAFHPHMSPAEAHRCLPAAVAASRREYLCRSCGSWTRWVRGRTTTGLSPDCALWWETGRALPDAGMRSVLMCETCDAPALVDECESRDAHPTTERTTTR